MARLQLHIWPLETEQEGVVCIDVDAGVNDIGEISVIYNPIGPDATDWDEVV